MASWRPGDDWGGWLMKRCTRLFRPVFYYLAFWAIALAVLHRVLPVHVYEPIAGICIQLLWFLGAYVLMLAAMPLLCRITTTWRQLAGGVAAVYAFVAVGRRHAAARSPRCRLLGYLNLVGVADPGHVRGRLPPRPARRPRGAAAGPGRCWPSTSRCWRSGPTS